MKKLIGSCLLALVFVAPVASHAQTVTQEEVNAQLQTILNSLLAQVQELMKQLIAMQAKQVEQGQTLTTIQTQTAPAPVLGAVSAPAYTVTLGTPYCNEYKAPKVPITISGDWRTAITEIFNGGPGFTNSKNGFDNNGYEKIIDARGVGTFPVKVTLSNNKEYTNSESPSMIIYTFNGEVTLPTCQ